MRSVLRTVAGAAATALLLSACASNEEPRARRLPTDLDLAAALTPFDSCDSLLDWIRPEARDRVTAYGLGGGPLYSVMEDAAGADALRGVVPEAAAPSTTAPAAENEAKGDFSTTNVQVEGVDEPDTVKTDGDRIVALAQGRLQVVDVSGGEPRVVGSLSLDDGAGTELLLAGDRALVLGTGPWNVVPMAAAAQERIGALLPPNGETSVLTEVDLSDPAHPRVASRLSVEGSYLSARMVGDVARIVVHSDPQQRLAFLQPATANPASEQQAIEANRHVIDESTADDWLPHYFVTEDGDVREEGRLLDCDDAARPDVFSGFGMLSVLTVDLSDGLRAGIDARGGAGVMAGGQTVYATPEHLYVATTEYVDWDKLTDAQRERVDHDYGTEIHRFDISDPASTRYEVSGRVDGQLLNQFSLDEHRGNLRVATTAGSPWMSGAEASESSVVVLAERDGALAEIGKVGGLGRGETIHSVRFLGDVGYVVTFRQTDPLYTVDLSEPTAPAVVGELKLLGYSAYLHPVADGYLLGVGQDSTETGQRLGLQVSLFDVRDPSHPERIAQAAIAGAGSTAEVDHRAFLWWAKANLALIPVESYATEPFSGAVGFTVDTAAGTVVERGRVGHPQAAPQVTPGSAPMPIEPPDKITGGDAVGGEPATGMPAPDVWWSPQITRSLVIGDTVYTLSDAGLLASDLSTLTQRAWTSWPS